MTASQIESLRNEILEQIKSADSLQAVESARVSALGKKGSLTQLLKGVGKLPPEERKDFAKNANLLKAEVQDALQQRLTTVESEVLTTQLQSEKKDITLRARPERSGRIHPIIQTTEELISIYSELGFSYASGPDVEDDWHNFTALNIPQEHPARAMQDTFFMAEKRGEHHTVLRTQTSGVQIRTMENQKPPIRIIAPGRTYRSDYDMTHTPMFHQIEGLYIDKGVHFGHLKSTLIEFCKRFFEVDELPVRFRPSFFPFTEPSAEVDIGCSWTESGELVIGEGDGWLEILGCGMVHPKVLKNCGIDPEEYQGFAFGMGIERPAMLKYGIPDLRGMFEADSRWLKHYGFTPHSNSAFSKE